MFGLGMTEMIVIGVIALLVVGPKDLPRLFKGIAGFMRQIRKLTREFQGVVNDMIRESDLDDLRSSIDPTQDLRDAMRETEDEINEASNAVSNPFAQVTTSTEAVASADTPEPAPSPAAAAKKTPAVKKAAPAKKAPAKKATPAKKASTAKKTSTAASRSKASS